MRINWQVAIPLWAFIGAMIWVCILGVKLIDARYKAQREAQRVQEIKALAIEMFYAYNPEDLNEYSFDGIIREACRRVE